MTAPLLEVEGLRMHFFTRAGVVKAVDDVSFSLERGRVMGLVGESGSGKSMTGYSIMGLVDAPGRIVSGRIALNGRELTRLDAASWRKLRGDRIAMIFQDPMMTLNPVLRIDTQMVEAVLAHRSMSRRAALARCREALVRVGIASPDERLVAYPHQFSGGMRQRVAIAIALVNEPDVVIADEPTTALDVTIQGQILFEMQRLCRETGTGLIWITHDLSVIAGLADDVCVMYAGRIVESGPVDQVLERPLHPYTAGLLESIPSRNQPGRPLRQIPGMAPSLAALGDACAFRERCNRVATACASAPGTRVVSAGRSIRCCNPLA
jgi:peptide/nickel transport system ATP-binding protein